MKYLLIVLSTLLIASCSIKINKIPAPKLTCNDNFEFDQFVHMVGEKKEDVLYILQKYGDGDVNETYQIFLYKSCIESTRHGIMNAAKEIKYLIGVSKKK